MFVAYTLIEEIFERRKFREWDIPVKIFGFAVICFRGHKKNYVEIYFRGYC